MDLASIKIGLTWPSGKVYPEFSFIQTCKIFYKSYAVFPYHEFFCGVLVFRFGPHGKFCNILAGQQSPLITLRE